MNSWWIQETMRDTLIVEQQDERGNVIARGETALNDPEVLVNRIIGEWGALPGEAIHIAACSRTVIVPERGEKITRCEKLVQLRKK